MLAARHQASPLLYSFPTSLNEIHAKACSLKKIGLTCNQLSQLNCPIYARFRHFSTHICSFPNIRVYCSRSRFWRQKCRNRNRENRKSMTHGSSSSRCVLGEERSKKGEEYDTWDTHLMVANACKTVIIPSLFMPWTKQETGTPSSIPSSEQQTSNVHINSEVPMLTLSISRSSGSSQFFWGAHRCKMCARVTCS